VAVDDGNETQDLPLFRPEKWGREKRGHFLDMDEGGSVSSGKGNRPAASLIQGVLPGVITGKLDEIVALGRANSLWTLTFGLACCAIEMISTHMAHHDFDRFGIVTWPSPRQSDVMIVAGTVVKKMADPIRLLYEQMPDPKWVIAMGTCATSGGPYYRSYSVVMGVDHIVPVDIYVPGCPPRPEALMDGIMKLQEKIKRDAREGLMDEPARLAKDEQASPEGADDGAV
jgi:NADH-quinone oxidoreductase subunit B